MSPTFLRHAVHHGAKHQDIGAAVRAPPEPAVTAQTCRANRTQTKPILIPGHPRARHSRDHGGQGPHGMSHTQHWALVARQRGLLPRSAPLSKTAHGKTGKALCCPRPRAAVRAGMLRHRHGTLERPGRPLLPPVTWTGAEQQRQLCSSVISK